MKKKKAKATKQLAVVKDKKDLAWGGMSTVMGQSKIEGFKETNVYNVMRLAAKVFNLPPQGIDIMGDAPYINKIGRKYKLNEYSKGDYRFEISVLHLATPTEKYAIVKADLFVGTKNVGQGIGEATEDNIKLAAVKKTLNMMAETRAKNRAMDDYVTPRMYSELNERIMRFAKDEKLTEEQVSVISSAAQVSSEEMTTTPPLTGAFAAKPRETFTVDRSKKAAGHFECHQCAAVITEAEAKFSKSRFGKNLCRDCQVANRK